MCYHCYQPLFLRFDLNGRPLYLVQTYSLTLTLLGISQKCHSKQMANTVSQCVTTNFYYEIDQLGPQKNVTFTDLILLQGPPKRFFPGCVIPHQVQWEITQPRKNLFGGPCRYQLISRINRGTQTD